jgi:hypothetical protein
MQGVLGKEYDSTRASGRDAFEFTLGLRRVPKGMSEAVKSMKVGGRRIAIVPPELGYGDRRVGVVVPHATLIYDLELLEIAGLDRNLVRATIYGSISCYFRVFRECVHKYYGIFIVIIMIAFTKALLLR